MSVGSTSHLRLGLHLRRGQGQALRRIQLRVSSAAVRTLLAAPAAVWRISERLLRFFARSKAPSSPSFACVSAEAISASTVAAVTSLPMAWAQAAAAWPAAEATVHGASASGSGD